MTVADTITQLGIERKQLRLARTSSVDVVPEEYYDPSRTMRWTVAGLTLHGPYFFHTFGSLDRYFGAAKTISNVVKKTAIAQFVIFPPYLVGLFAYMGCMEGCGDIPAKVYQRVPDAFLGGCMFWPVANMVNFAIVPPTLRVPYLASVGSLWNCFLSWLNAREN